MTRPGAVPWTHTGLRNRALSELARWPELTSTVLASLDARQIHQDPRSGALTVHYRDDAWIRLDRAATVALLDYLEAARLWGAPRPLFPSRGRAGASRRGARLRPKAVIAVLRRARRPSAVPKSRPRGRRRPPSHR
ncbi:MAG: hypothetical protein AAGD06_23885 [Acidobacteriota bacterium]